MKKSEKLHKQLGFDSEEELHFSYWLAEAKAYGFVDGYEYQPETFDLSGIKLYPRLVQLKTKVRVEKLVLLSKHTYTPDFKVFATPKLIDLGFTPYPVDMAFYVDIKGKYNPRGSDKKAFRINQCWMMEKHGIYVHEIVPDKFFKETWVPTKIAWCKGRKNPTRVKRFNGCNLVNGL